MKTTKKSMGVSSDGVRGGDRGIATHAEQERIEIPLMEVGEFDITIEGTSPLIVHKFSDKNRQAIEDKQQKKAKGGKKARKPHEEYLACFYMLSGKPETSKAVYGIPVSALKGAAVNACSFVQGLTKVVARGAFHIVEQKNGMVALETDGGPKMREDTVRLSGPGGSLDLRYRPVFKDWSCTFRVTFNRSVISAEQIVNLFNVAGFSVGIMEWRPQRNGSYGMFRVQVEG